MLAASTLFPRAPAVDDVDGGDGVPRGFVTVSLQDMLRARLPRLIVTPAILAVIVALYLVMAGTSGEFAFSPQTLDRWGAQFGPAIAAGQWWRLLTAMWLHANPLHLGLNALFLWRFGAYVERLLGPVVFFIVYLLSGVIASIVSLQFQAGNGLSVGASGALFGLVGVLLTVAMTSRGSGVLGDMLAELRPNLVSLVSTNLILGFMVPGIDNAAHIGGLCGGLALGWLVGRHSLDAIPPVRLLVLPILLTAALAAGAIAVGGGRHDARAEVVRVGAQIDEAEAAFRTARQEIQAGRRTASDVAAEAERTVLPFVHEAQLRADDLLRAATARMSGAPREPDGRVLKRNLPTEVNAGMTLAHAWAATLAQYEEAWRMRIGGLRASEMARVAEADARIAIAIRNLSATLAGQ